MDPLQEDEYWSECRNAYSSDVLAEGFDFDSHAEQSTRGEYNYAMNNPIAFIDPTGMAAEYNWKTGKYMDNGREVPVIKRMVV